MGRKAMRIFMALLTMAFVSLAAIFLIFSIEKTRTQVIRTAGTDTARPIQSSPPRPVILLPHDEVKGPSAVREYIATMLRFQYSLENAYHVGLCGLRSEAYFNIFRVAHFKLSDELANRLNLSEAEARLADREVNRQFAQVHEGVPDFDIIKGC